jgi:hypothetical protein
MNTCETTPVEPAMNRFLTLDTDRFAHLDGGSQIRVTHGLLWVTIDGEPDDWLLARGQALSVPPGRHALAQALAAPVRALVTREAGWRERFAMAWHALAGREPAEAAT